MKNAHQAFPTKENLGMPRRNKTEFPQTVARIQLKRLYCRDKHELFTSPVLRHDTIIPHRKRSCQAFFSPVFAYGSYFLHKLP